MREIVAGYSTALERGDAGALVALLTEDVTWSMPPLPHWYHGLKAVTDFAVRVPLTSCGSWRHRPATANGQPAVACYLWNDDAGAHVAWSINVLTLRGERIAEITSFIGPEHFTPCPGSGGGPETGSREDRSIHHLCGRDPGGVERLRVHSELAVL
ncbi:MAG TPA: nuclear transport factor 2 family protein [Nonomuraea sp.]|nr:nuclear transport factor 2 family protein [Nonomuraea sp.]